MCLIVTIIMFVLAIQNLIQEHWLAGIVQLIISLGFLVMLIKSIQEARCSTDGSCNHCRITGWIAKLFPKKSN